MSIQILASHLGVVLGITGLQGLSVLFREVGIAFAIVCSNECNHLYAVVGLILYKQRVVSMQLETSFVYTMGSLRIHYLFFW